MAAHSLRSLRALTSFFMVAFKSSFCIHPNSAQRVTFQVSAPVSSASLSHLAILSLTFFSGHLPPELCPRVRMRLFQHLIDSRNSLVTIRRVAIRMFVFSTYMLSLLFFKQTYVQTNHETVHSNNYLYRIPIKGYLHKRRVQITSMTSFIPDEIWTLTDPMGTVSWDQQKH